MIYNQFLLTELIKAQVRAEQEAKQKEEQKQEPELIQESFPSLQGTDSSPSSPGRIGMLEEPIPSSNSSLRTPLFIKGGMVMGFFAATVMTTTYLLNLGYNGDERKVFKNGAIECRQVDGVYAHTIVTKSHPRYGKDSIIVEQNSWNKSRFYIGYKGCSSVDEIITKEGILGTGDSLHYLRSKDGEIKQEMFAQADAKMQEQCERFRSLMNPYLP